MRLSSNLVPACFSYSLRAVSKRDWRLDSEAIALRVYYNCQASARSRYRAKRDAACERISKPILGAFISRDPLAEQVGLDRVPQTVEVVSPPSSHNSYGKVCDLLAELSFVAYLRSSLTPGPFRDCKLETPLRKRRSRVSITNEFSVKRQRVSEAIGSIDVSTDAEQRQEYADINAEPRVCSTSYSSYLRN